VSWLAAGAFALYARHAWSRYETFRSAGYDLGIFDQAIRHYAHFHAPIDAIKGPGFNLLGDHFSPALALLAPLYWIWADPRMLGFALAALLAGSAFPVFSFTERKLGRACALLVTLGYLLWWPMQGIVDFDFHEIAIAVPLVAWLIDALDRARYRAVVLLAVVLLGVREDMGILMITVAVIVAARRKLTLAGALAATGALAYLLVTKLVVPHFSPSGTWDYWDYPALGPNTAAAIGHVLAHPVSTLRLLVSTPVKRRTLSCLFAGPTALALASPYALLAAPIIAERMLSDRQTLWTTTFHYNAILAPILVLAAVDVTAKIVAALADQVPNGLARRGAATCFQFAFALGFAALAILGTVRDPGLYPLHNTLTGAETRQSPHTHAQAAAVAHVPSGVCVEADDRLIPHLVGRDYVTTPAHSGGRATWIALDLNQRTTGGGDSPAPAAEYATATKAGFRVVFRQGPLIVLHKTAPVQPECGHVD